MAVTCEHGWLLDGLLSKLIGENSGQLLLVGVFAQGIFAGSLLDNGLFDVADVLIGDRVVRWVTWSEVLRLR